MLDRMIEMTKVRKEGLFVAFIDMKKAVYVHLLTGQLLKFLMKNGHLITHFNQLQF